MGTKLLRFGGIVGVRFVYANDVQDYPGHDERTVTRDGSDQPPNSKINLAFVHLASTRNDEAQDRSDPGIPRLRLLLPSRGWHSHLPQRAVEKLATMLALFGRRRDYLRAVRAPDVGFYCCRGTHWSCHRLLPLSTSYTNDTHSPWTYKQ
jgi:hypothetical protein